MIGYGNRSWLLGIVAGYPALEESIIAADMDHLDTKTHGAT